MRTEPHRRERLAAHAATVAEAGRTAAAGGADLEVRGVTMRYVTRTGETTALSDVSVHIRPGERVALLGPNGSGKTTLVKCIASLLTPTQGRITVQGEDVSKSRVFLGHLGAVLEGSRNVYWRLTPYENARYFARLRGRQDDRRIRELLERFEVPGAFTSEVGKLSTGNKQKVAIVCALVHDPSLLLLDEPTLGLDVDAVAQLKRTMRGLCEEQPATLLVTSHDLGFVEDVCDRFLVISQGRIVFDGSLASLKARLEGHRVRITAMRPPGPVAAPPWASLPGAEIRARGELDCVEVRVAGPGDVVGLMARLLPWRDQITEIAVDGGSLEEAYRSVLVPGDAP